jgi:magnesium chelatase subunit I
MNRAKTLGELKKSGYKSLTIKQELRKNLLMLLSKGENPFPGIYGYENTVIPQVERAILAGHNINFLGLRGQAKTRMARLMVNLLDEFIPVIAGSELNEDPLHPITEHTRQRILAEGDDLPISWLHRNERYTEKLATPDVSVADLIGDLDPIKASNLKLSFSDPQVIHYGLVPRTHRGIFVINELPDLQARIQVALLNILQEGDIQIRGFRFRLPLDIQFVFTANPEDYTQRGSIITPLKDRIESQILTHYPHTIEISRKITDAEAHVLPEQAERITVSDLIKDIIEQIAVEGRKSEFVDPKSGISARLTITARELAVSTAEWRLLKTGENKGWVRISDLSGITPAVNGKVELMYEGDLEGPSKVAGHLTGNAIKTLFARWFPSPERIRRKKEENPYLPITEWFGNGNMAEFFVDSSTEEYRQTLDSIPGLRACVLKYHPNSTGDEIYLLMEFVLFGLSQYSVISCHTDTDGTLFKDILGSILNRDDDDR